MIEWQQEIIPLENAMHELFNEAELIPYLQRLFAHNDLTEDLIDSLYEESERVARLLRTVDDELRTKKGLLLFHRQLLTSTLGRAIEEDEYKLAMNSLGNENYVPIRKKISEVLHGSPRMTLHPVPVFEKLLELEQDTVTTREPKKIFTLHSQETIPVTPAKEMPRPVYEDIPAGMSFDAKIRLPPEMCALIEARASLVIAINCETDKEREKQYLSLHNLYNMIFEGFLLHEVHAFLSIPGSYEMRIEEGWVLHLVDKRT